MNNTVNKLILDRGSCEKLHKKLRFADPVFITSGIYYYSENRTTSRIWKVLPNMVFPRFGGGGEMAAFWECVCKLSWTPLSPARVQPLYGAGRKENSGTGLASVIVSVTSNVGVARLLKPTLQAARSHVSLTVTLTHLLVLRSASRFSRKRETIRSLMWIHLIISYDSISRKDSCSALMTRIYLEISTHPQDKCHR